MRGSLLRRRVQGQKPGGFTLLEVLIAISVLAVAVGLTGSTIVSISNYAQVAKENSLARAALSTQLQILQSYPFADVFRDFNESDADDTSVDAPGPGFDVLGLNPVQGDPDGRVGRFELPTPATDPTVLREDLMLPDLGMPADLNADGLFDDQDHSGDYRMLPMRIILEWDGRMGPSQLTLETVIGSW